MNNSRSGGPSGAPADPESPLALEPSSDDTAPTPRIRSRELFGPGRRVIIEHSGREYSLIITRQGKLLLNRC